MNHKQLTWQDLQPDILKYKSVFSKIKDEKINPLEKVQPRLINGLAHLHHQKQGFPILLLCSQENRDYLKVISQIAKSFFSTSSELFGGEYQIINDTVILKPPSEIENPFTSHGEVCFADWIEKRLLFGYACIYKNKIHLEPGLIHKANGGTLILSLKSILLKSEIWFQLKKSIEQGYTELGSLNEKRPLPLSIPALPLKLNLVLCGDMESLCNFQKIDSESYKMAIYTEFEENMKILNEDDMLSWCRWTTNLAEQSGLPLPEESFWPELVKEGVRFSNDKETLPLCPRWLIRQIRESVLIMNDTLNDKALCNALKVRLWRESYLKDLINNDIFLKQNLIETEGQVIGQINGLTVVDYPGHPRLICHPSRITCVAYPGNNDLIDIEGDSELGGNIYIKSMMIIQSYLMAELKIQSPFVASLVFEQSYFEIDGDSASLAGLCVLISALAEYPINQQIAVTGSIDQLGNIQPVGALNEKIESFFDICYERNLTGQQGVIIPTQNIRHLSLKDDLVEVVKQNKFHIWAVKHVSEAIYLLTGKLWNSKNNKENCLLYNIQKRIINQNQNTIPRSNSNRWFNWFNNK
ncbi:Lon protease [Candidatus Pantoea edessiphila]|uniref:endopeptidase La n=1 Tax=Candidatus Pantoea edessiphila TaxID=2044610 RepID=A0A2P5T2I5_9GAMM|nr:AAA family ATPase [Candidatus Pantoea edessiphila]PPI88762.1 Lon protease [Candidatus Pantoea edessiphila]